MEIAQIIGLALLTTILLLILRQEKPVMAVILSIVFSIVIFTVMMGKMAQVINVMQELSHRAVINYFFLATVLKILLNKGIYNIQHIIDIETNTAPNKYILLNIFISNIECLSDLHSNTCKS